MILVCIIIQFLLILDKNLAILLIILRFIFSTYFLWKYAYGNMLWVLRLSNRWSTYYNIYIKQIDNKKTEGESVFLTQTHLMPLGSFFTSWKHQKTRGFLMFSGDTERDQWHEMGNNKLVGNLTFNLLI